MVQCAPFEISKEVYDRAVNGKGKINYIADEDMPKLFADWKLYGYGVYSPIAYEENGKYWCRYNMGSTCD